MIYLVPPKAAEIHNIPNVIAGSFKMKIEAAFANDVLIMETNDDEYELLKDTLKACDFDVFIVIMIPDVQTPKCFLHEIDDSMIINFNKLDLIPKDDDDEFMNKLKTSGSLPDDGKEEDENI